MNENAKKWVAALRSGEFEQGQMYLNKEDDRGRERLCCLGVACELYARSGEPIAVNRNEGDVVTYEGQDEWLPERVQKWLGLRTDCKSFAEIADIIESEPKGLFV